MFTMEIVLPRAVMCNGNIGAMAILEMGVLLNIELFAKLTIMKYKWGHYCAGHCLQR